MRPFGRLRGYVVCATPRTGSNYLAQLLASTGVLGRPREYFNADGRRRYDDPDYPEDPRRQLEQVVTTGATTSSARRCRGRGRSRPTSTARATRPWVSRSTTGR